MAITFIYPLPSGDAIRILLSPRPAGQSRVLVRSSLSGIIDTRGVGDLIISANESSALDTTLLVNGQTYYYRAFITSDGLNWVADGGEQPGTPAATFLSRGISPLDLIRERVESGMLVCIGNGAIVHQAGFVPVMTAAPQFEEANWPVVAVHQDAVQSDGERFIGDLIAPDWFNEETGEMEEYEGWLSRHSINITAWCLNPDERIAYRRAIEAVIGANLGIFGDAGMVEISITQQDTEDYATYSAPVYMTSTILSCLAPTIISASHAMINEIYIGDIYE
jgi:hypothetical protein